MTGKSGIFISHSHNEPDRKFIESLYGILKYNFYGYGKKDIICDKIYCSSHGLQDADRANVIRHIKDRITEVFFLFGTHNSMNSPSIGWEKGFYEGFYENRERAKVLHFGIIDFKGCFWLPNLFLHLSDVTVYLRCLIVFSLYS